MELKDMTVQELTERRTAIGVEVDEAADKEAAESLLAEVRAINEELNARIEEEAKKEEIRQAVASGAGETIKDKIVEEEKKMGMKELRASEEYINAYADYIKNGKDNEIRMLISANAPDGTEGDIVPVPTYLEERIMTAWEKNDILSRVKKTFVRGNLEVTYELSATGAEIHAEGAEAPQEEALVLDTIKMVPEMIKKWITLTDTVVKLKGREFLDYLYDEITYRITLKAVEVAVNDIVSAPAVSGSGAIGVPVISGAPSVTIIPEAAAHLSSDAGTPVVLMNRLTEVEFLQVAASGGFFVDPFAGLEKIYTSALKAYSAASSGDTYIIVGNLYGEHFNFPDGEDVEIIYDPYTKAEENKVKVVGRYFAAHGVTGLGHFTKINK